MRRSLLVAFIFLAIPAGLFAHQIAFPKTVHAQAATCGNFPDCGDEYNHECPGERVCRANFRQQRCRCILVGGGGSTPTPTPTETPVPPPNFLTPFPEPYVPCDETRPEEFHSLRPYQASPCNQDLEDIALFCGNDLVLTDEVTIIKSFNPADFYDWTYSLIEQQVPGGTLQTQITPVPPEFPIIGRACFYCSNGVCVQNTANACIPDPEINCTTSADCSQSCIDNGDGTETCKFNITRDRDIAVDLLGAYLPIMGNTELVVNSRRQNVTSPGVNVTGTFYCDPDVLTGRCVNNCNPGFYADCLIDPQGLAPCLGPYNPTACVSSGFNETLNDPVKVNEYVSWYMNGLIGRAEYDRPNTTSQAGRDRVINYSGPLKRLLSFESQIVRREEEVQKALTSLDCDPNADPRDPNCIRHDQYIGCYNLLGNPTHCYPDRIGITNQRLSYWEDQFPPLARAFSTLNAYLTAFDLWRTTTIWKLYSYIPFSSTEDRMGEVDFGTYTIQPAISNRFVILSSQLLNQHPAELFFAHMQESFELADLFQQIYAPQEADLNAEPEPAVASTSEFCDLRAVRSNPGDNLFPGELSATIHYEAQVTCDFCIPDPDIPGNLCRCLSFQNADCQSGYDYCLTDYGRVDCNYGETCGNDCGYLPSGEFCDSHFYGKECYPNDWGPCSGTVSSGVPGLLYCPPGYTCASSCNQPGPTQINLVLECNNTVLISFRTITKTPLAKEVWSKLVAGPTSVFRKMFPQITDEPGRPIRRLWDIPGATSVVYQVLTPGVTVSAGDPSSGRGDQGELYFPHIGGIHEYFLKCIQKTIRPQGFGEGCATGPEPLAQRLATGGDCSPVGGLESTGYCTIGTGLCSPSYLRRFFVEAGCPNPTRSSQQASIICNGESGANPLAFNCRCLEGITFDYSVGLFQINLLAHCAPYAFETNRPWCTIVDQAAVDACLDRFFDPDENARYMVQISSCGTNWTPWSVYTVTCQNEIDSVP